MVAKCPKCEKEIDKLHNIQSGEMVYDFDGENYERNRHQDFFTDDRVNTWNCPECDEVLFTDEEKAKEFLMSK